MWTYGVGVYCDNATVVYQHTSLKYIDTLHWRVFIYPPHPEKTAEAGTDATNKHLRQSRIYTYLVKIYQHG